MTATAHAAIGALIAARFSDPLVSIPFSLASHYLTDIIPHWDSSTNRAKKSEKRHLIEATIDGLVGLIIAGFIYFYIFGLTDYFYLYLVVGFSLLPDILTVFTRFIIKKENVLWDWNNNLQKKLNRKMQLPWGILTQIIAIGVIYILLFSIFI